MSKIRIKLDLSDFYDDKKRFAFVLIDPEWKNVKCLQRHVEKLFNLCSVEFVAVPHSCYLPPREDIGVVNSGDVLRVVAAESSNTVKNVLEPVDTEEMPRKKKKLKECNKDIPNNVETEKEDRKIRKRKYPVENAETCPFNTNVIINSTVSVKKLKNIFDQKFAECDSFGSKSWKEQEVKDTTKESIASNCISEDAEIATKSKRKRKRKKKLKKSSEVVTEDSFKNRIITKNKCFKSTPIATVKSQGHIRFDDDGKAAANEDNSEKTSIVFTSYLDNLNKSKARIIKGTVINNSSAQNGIQDHKEKETNEITQEHSVQNGIVLHNTEPTASINGTYIDEKLNIEESPTQATNGFPAVSKIQSETFSTKQILSLSEPLLGEPTIGDILIFKIYRLNECSEPSLSDFICGKFEDIEESSQLMKIFLIDGQDQLVDFEGNTFMNLDMRGPDYLFLKYEDLIDKKVFRM